MVHLSGSCTSASDETTTAAAAWIELIDSEYREMPGLRLTLAQAARLWGLLAPQCRTLLAVLVERGRLMETPDGLYCVASGLRRARRETVSRLSTYP